MQLTLILGIIFAIGAAIFAMQNNTPVTVTVALWTFDGSLALVLLMAMGLGALIAGLVSSPAMIRRQWSAARLGRQVSEFERKLNESTRRNDELQAELARLQDNASPAVEPIIAEKPYVGLRALMAGGEETKPSSS